jgi:hypothetical protein
VASTANQPKNAAAVVRPSGYDSRQIGSVSHKQLEHGGISVAEGRNVPNSQLFVALTPPPLDHLTKVGKTAELNTWKRRGWYELALGVLAPQPHRLVSSLKKNPIGAGQKPLQRHCQSPNVGDIACALCHSFLWFIHYCFQILWS